MKNTFENGILTIFPENSIDTNNAEAVGAEIAAIRAEHPEGKLVLDMDDLRYISSAGLRQILKLKKKEKDFAIINCSSEVYEIFEMTGFAEMMDIEKGYRRMSVEGCEKIGEGSNGIVYRLNEDTIIKVYKNSDALDDIKRERELARKALVLGINTAIPFDVVRVGDMYGSVFELLSAKSITKWIISDPDNKDEYIRVFADLLKEIHHTEVKDGSLPDARKTALGWADWLEDHIPEKTYRKLHSLIEGVPESDMMIHGDYHSNNVHYDKEEAILIDMDTLSVGDPIFEFASIFLAYQGYGILDHHVVEEFLKLDWDTAAYILNKLVEMYYDDRDEAQRAEIMEKAKVVGFTRMLRRTIKRTPENKELIDYTRKQLIDLVDRTDSLRIE
jgi:uncharacterized protein (TIGR02172 family)